MAIILKRYDDLSYQEIAQILGCSVPAVESLLVRAKRTLQKKLKEFSKMTAGFWLESCLIQLRAHIILEWRQTMKCHSVQKKFSAYQDRELKPQEQEEISRHLLSCRSCREQYAEFERALANPGRVGRNPSGSVVLPASCWKDKEPREQGLLPILQHVFQLLRAPAIASLLLIVGILAGSLSREISWPDMISFRFRRTALSYSQEALFDFLKVFDPAPPGTLAHGYLQMVNYKEKESR